MPSLAPLRDALRERLTARSVGTTLVLAAGLHHFLGASPTQVAIATIITAVVGLGDVAQDAYDVREAVAHGWNGALAFAGTGLLYALGEDPPLWFLAVFGSIGAWFVLDAVQTARHEGVVERERDGREVYHEYVARRVHETLEERPRTRRELHDALDADSEDVDDAVADLRDRGVLVEAGSELRVDESDEATLARVGGWIRGVARRLARPVTLEFRDDDNEKPATDPVVSADDATDAADTPGVAAGASEAAGDAHTRGSGTETATDRERELSRN